MLLKKKIEDNKNFKLSFQEKQNLLKLRGFSKKYNAKYFYFSAYRFWQKQTGKEVFLFAIVRKCIDKNDCFQTEENKADFLKYDLSIIVDDNILIDLTKET